MTKLVSDSSPLFIGVEAGTWVLAPSEIGLERKFSLGRKLHFVQLKCMEQRRMTSLTLERVFLVSGSDFEITL